MSDPLNALGDAAVATMFVVTFGATVSWGALFPPLRAPLTPRGIVDLELAATTPRTIEILDEWRARNLFGSARLSVLLDLPWIVFYTCALAAIGVLATRAAEASRLLEPSAADALGAALVYAALAAGLLDCAEDGGLWLALKEHDDREPHVDQPLPALTAVVAYLKWLLVIVVAATSVILLAISGIAALLC